MWGLAEENMFWKVESCSHSLTSLKTTALLAHLKFAQEITGHLKTRYNTSFARYQVVKSEQPECITPSFPICNNNHCIEKEILSQLLFLKFIFELSLSQIFLPCFAFILDVRTYLFNKGFSSLMPTKLVSQWTSLNPLQNCIIFCVRPAKN